MNPVAALALEVPPPTSRTLRTALYSQLRDAIRDGRIACGERLPASRQLAAQIGRSRTSGVAVYERLIAEGLADARVGAGVFGVATLATVLFWPKASSPLTSAKLHIAPRAGDDMRGVLVMGTFE